MFVWEPWVEVWHVLLAAVALACAVYLCLRLFRYAVAPEYTWGCGGTLHQLAYITQAERKLLIRAAKNDQAGKATAYGVTCYTDTIDDRMDTQSLGNADSDHSYDMDVEMTDVIDDDVYANDDTMRDVNTEANEVVDLADDEVADVTPSGDAVSRRLAEAEAAGQVFAVDDDDDD